MGRPRLIRRSVVMAPAAAGAEPKLAPVGSSFTRFKLEAAGYTSRTSHASDAFIFQHGACTVHFLRRCGRGSWPQHNADQR